MARSSRMEEFTLVTSKDVDLEQMTEWSDVWTDLAGPLADEVSFSRLRDAIKMSELGRQVPDEVIIGALEKADQNYDGVLQKSEFMALVQDPPRSAPLRRLLREAAWCAVPASERDFSKRSYFEYYSCLPPPLFIPIISLVQVAAFIYYAVDMDVPMKAMSPCPTYSPLVYDPARRYEAWRYVTYMAVHSGWVHLLSNLIMQLAFGVILEIVHGPARISIIYLCGVLCGALATSVSTPGFFLAGASGGVYAIQYAHLGNLVINWAEIQYPVVQTLVIAVVSLVDMSYSIYDTFFVDDPSHTGHLAHIGGALCGLLLGVCVLRNLKKLDWERYCIIGAAVLLSVLVLTTVLVNIFNTSYYPPNDYTSMAELRENWMNLYQSRYYYPGQ